MNSNIKDIKSLLDYVERNKKNIYRKIFQSYGLPTSKIRNLPDIENDLLVLSTGIDMSIEEKLTKLMEKYGDDNKEIFFQVKDDFEFNSKFGFFEVLSDKARGSVHVVDLKSSIFETLVTNDSDPLRKGDVLFGLSFFDIETNLFTLYKSFIVLTKEEKEIIENIYDEYIVDDDVDVFFDNIVLPRLMKKQLNLIDQLLTKHTPALMENFDQISIYNFFKHFSDTVKYSLFNKKEVSIFNLDYFDFLMKETEAGNFIIEGDLELFIDILEFVMTREVMLSPDKSEVLKSINKCKDKLLILKNNLSLKYPQTSMDLVNLLVDSEFLKKPEPSRILLMPLFMDELANLEKPKVTNKTRKLTAKTIRNLLSDNTLLGNFTLLSKSDNEEIIQLAVAILLSNGMAKIDNEDEIYFTNRFGYFIMAPSEEVAANFLTAVFTENTLKQYIGLKNEDYKKLLKDMQDFIQTLDDSEIKKTPGGKKMLKIFELIGLIDKKIIDGNETFAWTLLGETYVEYLKSKSHKGKVLHLKNYKRLENKL